VLTEKNNQSNQAATADEQYMPSLVRRLLLLLTFATPLLPSSLAGRTPLIALLFLPRSCSGEGASLPLALWHTALLLGKRDKQLAPTQDDYVHVHLASRESVGF